MLNLGVRNLQKQKRPARRVSADRRLSLGVDHRSRPKVRKASFAFIFATDLAAKEDITGVNTLLRARRDHIYRYGIWDGIELPLKRWFDRWMARGGKAIL